MAHLRETLTYEPAELAFGTSGLRGLVTDMTDLECYINARGFLQYVQQNDEYEAGKPVYLAGDLRDSTPRVMAAMHKAITDAGYQTVNCGLIPTPAVAYYALQNGAPCIMVTGSHIPSDRNGIKFYKCAGEVLKEDEAPIKLAVAAVRTQQYDAEQSLFTTEGMFTEEPVLPAEDTAAATTYIDRYVSVFGAEALQGKEVVMYQHSAVGRDLIADLLQKLGATVTPVGRSDVFVPIDTENVTPKDQAYFHQLAQENPGAFAIVSTDGDSDRPFVIDATGEFHRGDVLGAVVANWIKADFAAFPVSSSDAVDSFLTAQNVGWMHTKIGSPYVIEAMEDAASSGKQRVTGWEVNGGFLLGADLQVGQGTLKALPTRDAVLPILIALIAANDANTPVADVFAALPARATQAGLIDNFPTEVSKAIVARFAHDTPEVYAALAQFFTPEHGFGAITKVNSLDGVRIYFDNGDIAHLRPSGNAPQLRIYSVSATQARADEIVALAIAEPDGIFRTIQNAIAA